MVAIVDRPTVHCLTPSPKAVVWVCIAEELNISPQVEIILCRIELSPVTNMKFLGPYNFQEEISKYINL